MAGLGAKDILRNVTALEQLIEEINFQRAKEMRQCLMSKDADTGFVVVHGTTYWTDLFVRHFLFQTDRCTDADDLLFFIRKKHVRGSRHVPKYHTEVEVYRKDSRKLPIGDPDIDWEETVYLNLIIHQFDYTLTLAVCTRTSPKDLQVLRRHSQKVYASPSRRRMDTKGEVEEITYPNVCFHVDNFDEVFSDMQVRDGEMVCVELVAADHSGTRQAVIFLGSIRYDALKRVYDARASLSSKVAQRMMMGLFSGSNNQRIEFVRMKGPLGKGHAEMAVTKPKGSGVETPTSEPGVSLTDLWDCDWEDEPEDRLLYRHQRRLSDPSANFNTFINSGWRARGMGAGGGQEGGRSRSENEGLDSFADGLYEIESGDVRDGSLCGGPCCIVCGARQPVSTDDEIDASHNTIERSRCVRCRHFHSTRPVTGEVTSAGREGDGETVPLLRKHLPTAVPATADEKQSVRGISAGADNVANELRSTSAGGYQPSIEAMGRDVDPLAGLTVTDRTKLSSTASEGTSPQAEPPASSAGESNVTKKPSNPEQVGPSTTENDEPLILFNEDLVVEKAVDEVQADLALINIGDDVDSDTKIREPVSEPCSGFEIISGRDCPPVTEQALTGGTNAFCEEESGEEPEEFEPLLTGTQHTSRTNRKRNIPKTNSLSDVPEVEFLHPIKQLSEFVHPQKQPSRSMKSHGTETRNIPSSEYDKNQSGSDDRRVRQTRTHSLDMASNTGLSELSSTNPCVDSALCPKVDAFCTLPRTKGGNIKKPPGTAVRVSGQESQGVAGSPSSSHQASRSSHTVPTSSFESPRRRFLTNACIKGTRVIYRDLPVEDSDIQGEVDSATEARAEEEDSDASENAEASTLNPLLQIKKQKRRRKISMPYRIAPDGTTFNFICDIKLDDGAYNPLWSTRGFTQTFHFWKENRRAQSVPFNAYLTYVTLPWFNIITDILDHETGPILTF